MTEYGLRRTILEHIELLSMITTYTSFTMGKVVFRAASRHEKTFESLSRKDHLVNCTLYTVIIRH